MPTLLSINNHYYLRDGSEAVFFEHNRVFEKLGWNVVPFSKQHHKNLDTSWSKYFVNEIEFGQPYSIWEKVVRIPKTIYSFESRRMLEHLLNSEKIDVSHCHIIYHNISPSILSLLKRHKVPTVLTLHDLKLACPAYFMFNRGRICERCKGGKLYNVFIQRCIKGSSALSAIVMVERLLHSILGTYEHYVDRFVVPSRFYKKKMVEWGWDPDRFVYIPNAINANVFRPDFNIGKAFLYFGRLSPEKGLTTLIKAAAKAKVPVRIAGTGPQTTILKKVIDETHSDTTFLGYLTGEDLHDAIRSARATVLPSEWYENAPMSILESYGIGKPVIGASIGGIPEMIREGVTGITFKSGSVESLAGALRRIADTPDSKLMEMGRHGRHWVEKNFSTEQYREHVLALYSDIGVTL